MSGEELSADDAWHTVRRYGLRRLLFASFLRCRYGDGFSHARAFRPAARTGGVPTVIAGAGLATAIGPSRWRRSSRARWWTSRR